MKISIAFELIEKETKEVVSSALDSNPFEFEVASGDIDGFLELALKDLSQSETFEFTFLAKEAYGELDDTLVEEIDIKPFIDENGEPLDGFAIGNILQLTDESGSGKDGVLLDYNDQFAVIDFNHPLAGTDLVFRGKVISKS
jgi:FKBP-type peptidyl-prolyl cis-trans isomerase SlyD